MPPVRTPLIALLAFAGGAIGAQAPEFAQQYRQRLGGAVAELRTVAQDFDRDARAEGLERQAALEQLKRSQDTLAQRRGTSMGVTLERYENLLDQSVALEGAQTMSRPIEVLRFPDRQIIEQAWDAYEPAVPLTQEGIGWGIIGAFGALIAGWGMTWPFRRKRRSQAAATRGA